MTRSFGHDHRFYLLENHQNKKTRAINLLLLLLSLALSQSTFMSSPFLQRVAAHVRTDTVVVEDGLDAADSAHGNVLIPQFAGGEVHDILLGDLADRALDVLGAEAAAGGDDLATNVFGNGGGAVKGEEDGGLQLSLSALNLSGGDVVAQAGPFTEGEVDEVLEAGDVLGGQVDTPQTVYQSISENLSRTNSI